MKSRQPCIVTMVELALRLAVATFAGLLSLSAVGIFIWMAASQWNDTTGTTVGVILILMAGCQLVGSVVWFRLQRSTSSVISSVDRRKRDDDEREL